MADADVFPRWMFPAGGPTDPDYGGREFASKAELDAAEGQWYPTPQDAQAAKATPPAAARPTPTPEADEEDRTTRRSHR